MKKTLLLFLTVIAGHGFCDNNAEPLPPPKVRQSMNYFDIGAGPLPIPIPVFGIGYRVQNHHDGLDFSFHASSVIAATHLKASALYHYYPNPSYTSQFYIGSGVSLGKLLFIDSPDETLDLLAPEFVFGRQYRTKTNDKRFLQVQTSWPIFAWERKHSTHKYEGSLYMPIVTITYGMGF